MKLRTILIVVLASALAATACADSQAGSADGTGPSGGTGGTGGTGGITHPGGANDLVLRVSVEGGFVPAEYLLSSIPGFTLYGDGTVVTTGAQIEIYPQPALPALVTTTLTEGAVQAILQAALDAGLGSDRVLSDATVADAPTTVFTLVANGERHVTSVYALGFGAEASLGTGAKDGEIRAALQAFSERLGALRDWLPDGSVGQDRPYSPTAIRMFFGPYQPVPDLEQSPIDWPIPEIDLGAFGQSIEQGLRCGVVSDEALSALFPVLRDANQLTPWVSEGVRYRMIFRPLLPDESGC